MVVLVWFWYKKEEGANTTDSGALELAAAEALQKPLGQTDDTVVNLMVLKEDESAMAAAINTKMVGMKLFIMQWVMR